MIIKRANGEMIAQAATLQVAGADDYSLTFDVNGADGGFRLIFAFSEIEMMARAYRLAQSESDKAMRRKLTRR